MNDRAMVARPPPRPSGGAAGGAGAVAVEEPAGPAPAAPAPGRTPPRAAGAPRPAPADPLPSLVLAPVAPGLRLETQPTRFSLDTAAALAARVLNGADAPSALLSLRYSTVARLGYPGGEVARCRPVEGELTVTTFGLVGTGGALPRHVTAATAAEERRRGGGGGEGGVRRPPALHAFLDFAAGRFVGFFVRAGAKHKPTRDPLPAERVLAAAIGLGTPGLGRADLAPRLAVPFDQLLYHAGHLASRTRSAERLRAMLEDETGGRVDVAEFGGGWLRLPLAERTRVGASGAHAALGVDAACGAQVWDAQARFTVRIGPLPRREFDRLLPGTPRHRRLVDLTRFFVGLDTGFAVNLVLAAEAVPPLRLGGEGRLGWSSWLTSPKPRARDGAEPLFEPGATERTAPP